MATDSSDVVGALRGFPINFVARYYRDPASRWPALSPAEAERISALGLKIVTVWEWHSADPAYFTYAAGYSDALSASRQAKAVGQPLGSAIYFAVDYNARGSQLAQIDQYFRGVNAGFAVAGNGRPEYRVGVYGSGAVCSAVKEAGLAQYAWLTGSTAWEGTNGYTAWNIKQAPHGARFANLAFDHDANEARNDYGGFQLASYAGPSPAATAIAVAAAVPVAAATVVTSAVTAVVPPSPPAPMPAAPPVATASSVASVPLAPPVAPVQSASPAPAAIQASIAPPTPAPPPPVAAPPPAPPPSTAGRMEAAALEAASLAAASVLPHSAAAAEMPHPSLRSAEAARGRAAEEASHEHTAARVTKASVGTKRGSYAVATNNRAAAVPLRHAGGSSHSETHRVSAPRRAEDHSAHQGGGHGTVRASDRPAKRSVDRSHRAAGVPG
jgi:hypothetical protein